MIIQCYTMRTGQYNWSFLHTIQFYRGDENKKYDSLRVKIVLFKYVRSTPMNLKIIRIEIPFVVENLFVDFYIMKKKLILSMFFFPLKLYSFFITLEGKRIFSGLSAYSYIVDIAIN